MTLPLSRALAFAVASACLSLSRAAWCCIATASGARIADKAIGADGLIDQQVVDNDLRQTQLDDQQKALAKQAIADANAVEAAIRQDQPSTLNRLSLPDGRSKLRRIGELHALEGAVVALSATDDLDQRSHRR